MSLSPTKVLVAESDEIVLALISHILHRQGYVVDVAVSCAEAANNLKKNQYRAVILDGRMSALLESFPDAMPRTILLSPRMISDERVHAVIQKPVEFGFLVETVAACVK